MARLFVVCHILPLLFGVYSCERNVPASFVSLVYEHEENVVMILDK
jgi:hypothetical protein